MTEARALVDRVNQRIRGEAHTEAFMLELVSKCQQVINAGTRLVIETAPFVTEANKQVYWTEPQLPNLVYLLALRENGVADLERLLDWHELLYRSRRWSRETRQTFDSFAMVGRDLVIIHPAKTVNDELTAVYVKLTAPFDQPDTTVDLPDSRTQLVVDLAESLLLLRERRLESLVPVVDRIAKELGLDAYRRD